MNRIIDDFIARARENTGKGLDIRKPIQKAINAHAESVNCITVLCNLQPDQLLEYVIRCLVKT